MRVSRRSGSPTNMNSGGGDDDERSIRLVEYHGEYGSQRAALAGKGRQEIQVEDEEDEFNYSPTTLQASRNALNNSTGSYTRTDINSNGARTSGGDRSRDEDYSRSKSLSGPSYPGSLLMGTGKSLNQSQYLNSRNNSAPTFNRNLDAQQYSNIGQGSSMIGDRSTWNSEYDSQGVAISDGLEKLNPSSSRDSFPQSVSNSFPSQTDMSIRSDFSFNPPNPTFARNSSASSYSAPTFRIGSSSPTPSSPTDSRPIYPQSPPHHLSVNTSPSKSFRDNPSSPISHPGTPVSGRSISGGRSPSLTFSKNFSRPFSGEQEIGSRSASFDSGDESRSMRNSVGGRSTSGQSISGNSIGGHSMSASWDGRLQIERQRYDSLLTPQDQHHSGQYSPSPNSPSYRDNYSTGSISPAPSSNSLSSIPPPLNPVSPTLELSSYPSSPSNPKSPNSTDSKRGRWSSIFKSKTSKAKLQTSREVDEDNFEPKELIIDDEKLIPITSNANDFNLRVAPLVGLFQSVSHSSGLTEDDWARNEKRRSDLMILKPSIGKSVKASYVHNGEGNLPDVWSGSTSEEMERLNSGDGGKINIGGLGPKRLLVDQRDSIASNASNNFSVYSLPADDNESRTSSTPTMRQGSPIFNNNNGFNRSTTPNGNSRPGTPMSTMEKTKFHLGKSNLSDPQIAEDFLQLGINYHESGELERSAWNFEQSAKRGGGCPGGLLMWGLALRSGWGVQVNAPLGFHYLQKAAELVVDSLDGLPTDAEGAKVAKNELVLALYELGISYRFGLGVTKDKKMAVSYYEMSANLGDPDAQSELAFCYANGKGCKKDMKLAAKYYRMAVEQGAHNFGLSWIYKPKYMD